MTTASAPARSAGAAPVRRTVEVCVAAVGAAAALVLMGGFSLVITRADERTFAATLYPRLLDAGLLPGPDVGVSTAYDMVRTLGAWFGMATMACLALTIVGIVLARRRAARRVTGVWFLAAGLVCLFGSQLLMYPVALPFFVSAGMFAVRKPDPGRSG